MTGTEARAAFNEGRALYVGPAKVVSLERVPSPSGNLLRIKLSNSDSNGLHSASGLTMKPQTRKPRKGMVALVNALRP